MHPQTPFDQEIVAWYDSQTEELLATLPGYEDGLTPRQAWYAFFNLCSSPATNTTGESLAAPAGDAQGAGTIECPVCHNAALESLCHLPPDPVFLCPFCWSEFNSDLSEVGA